MTARRTGLLAGFASLTGLRLLSAALSFSLVVYLARLLGPDALGTYSFVMAVFVLLQYLPTMGLHVAITRNVAAAPAEAGHQLVSAIILAVPATLATALALVAYTHWFLTGEPAARNNLLLIAVALVPTAFTTVVEAALIGCERSSRVALVGLAEATGRTLISLIALYLGHGVETLTAIFVIGRMLAALAYFRTAQVRALLTLARPHKTVFRGLARAAPVFFAIVVLAQLMDRMDFLMLGALTSLREVGEYAAPYKLYEFVLMLPRIASLLLMPRFAAFFLNEPFAFRLLVQSSMRVGIASLVPALVLSAYFAPEALRLFGRGYQNGSVVFMYLCAAAAGVAVNNVLSIVLIVTGKQRLDLLVLVVSTLVYGLLLAWLVPSYGASGAAAATMAIGFVQPVIAVAMLRQELSTGAIAGSLARIAIAGLIMVAALVLARPMAPIFAAALALALYGGALCALRVPSLKDLECLNLAFRTVPVVST